jgi:hypothetical protein
VRSFRSSGALATLALAALATACSSAAPLVGQGGACQLATDCKDGLICAPQKSGGSICTNNLGSVQQLPPTPPQPDSGAPSDAAVNDDATGLIPTTLPEASASD